MSQQRPIWNDGQGLATPDLQRGCDDVGAVDDRVHEVYMSPGLVQKRVTPLTEEVLNYNPRMLAIPSQAAFSVPGVDGGVRLGPCVLTAGAPSGNNAAFQVSLSGTLYGPLDTSAIASNSSGSTRYDLIYATLNRAVTVTGTRKIKSATDGSLSSQLINLADAPSITLGVNQGFLTGATAPTAAQIAAALPADTAPGPTTFGSFNFPIAYVTVLNGYTSGTVLAQDSIDASGGSYLTQCWPGGWVQRNQVRSAWAADWAGASPNEKPNTAPVTPTVASASRWGVGKRLVVPIQLLSTTTISPGAGGGVNIDNSINYRGRLVWGTYCYLGAASTVYPLQNAAATQATFAGTFGPNWTGNAQGVVLAPIQIGACPYNGGATSVLLYIGTGGLGIVRSGSVVNGAGGDAIVLVLEFSDQILASA